MEKIRLIILVDHPGRTRHERKMKRELEECLFKEGFVLLQSGVYTRLSDGRTNANLHESHLKSFMPETGIVRLITMTERQFQNSQLLSGQNTTQENEIDSQLDVFL